MQTWAYIPVRLSSDQAEILNELADEFGLNRSTVLRCIFKLATTAKLSKYALDRSLKDAQKNEPRSRPRGTPRKDKRL